MAFAEMATMVGLVHLIKRNFFILLTLFLVTRLELGSSFGGVGRVDQGDRPSEKKEIRIDGKLWPDTLEDLSRQANLRIVSFVPDKWVPEPFLGPLDKILAQIASRADAKWDQFEKVLFLRRAVGNFPSQPITKKDLEGWEADLRAPGQKLILLLEPEQLKRVGKGDIITPKDLLANQHEFLRQTLKSELSIKADDFFQVGKLRFAVNLGTDILWRGSDVQMFHELAAGEPWIEDDYAKHARSLNARQVKALIGQSQAIYGSTTISFEKNGLNTLGSLEKDPALQPAKKRFVVSAQIQDRSFFVTAGKWQVAEFLAVLQAGLHLEVREVEDLVFLGPSRSAKAIQAYKDTFHSCDVGWRRFAEVVHYFKDNRHNLLAPFTFEDVQAPKLIPWSKLSKAQKSFAAKIMPFPGGDRALEKRADDLELLLYPILRVDLIMPNQQFPIWRGFGPRSVYPWLVTRFKDRKDK